MKVKSFSMFTLEDTGCDHTGCERDADRFFVYELDHRTPMIAFACSSHPRLGSDLIEITAAIGGPNRLRGGQE